jgi:hypothetical protein
MKTENSQLQLIAYSIYCSAIILSLGFITEVFGNSAIDNSAIKIFFGLFLFVGPGIIYTLLIISQLNNSSLSSTQLFIFSILSIITYFLSSFLSSVNSEYTPIISSFSAVIFLLYIKIFLEKDIHIVTILISSVICYFAFIPEIGREFLKISFNISL